MVGQPCILNLPRWKKEIKKADNGILVCCCFKEKESSFYSDLPDRYDSVYFVKVNASAADEDFLEHIAPLRNVMPIYLFYKNGEKIGQMRGPAHPDIVCSNIDRLIAGEETLDFPKAKRKQKSRLRSVSTITYILICFVCFLAVFSRVLPSWMTDWLLE